MRFLTLFLSVILVAGCSSTPSKDKFIWLESVEGEKALNWSKDQNKKTLKVLAEGGDFERFKSDALGILEATDKLPKVALRGGKLYNFWQDAKQVRGLIRRTTEKSFKGKSIRWEPVLDLDKLAAQEKENWVYKGMNCLKPEERYCLVRLSRGGKDASVLREFDLKTKKFVDKGFQLPEAKSWVTWVDQNQLLVGTDFGKGSLTDSGYPRQLRLWKRGVRLKEAPLVFEGKSSDVWVSGSRLQHGKRSQVLVSQALDFFNTKEFVFNAETQKTFELAKPGGAEFMGYYAGFHLYLLRNPWTYGRRAYDTGDLMAIRSEKQNDKYVIMDAHRVFAPKRNQSFVGLAVLKTKLVISVLEDVKGTFFYTKWNNKKWQSLKVISTPSKGNVKLATWSDKADRLYYYFETYNKPSALFVQNVGGSSQKLKQIPSRFKDKNFTFEQRFAKSKDGTRVPYFMVYKKGTQWTGKNPTMLYGYGGFTISLTPKYQPLVGKLFLEQGGVYVVANIRGGGEYGPAWHKAALKQNRQKAYDDFISVAEDLVSTKVTSPKNLAIRGGSNGGLLVGAVMAQRPDLFGAVVCAVPLLDMVRFSKLLAGASWMGEYGNPDKPEELEYILKYSPYQNVFAEKKYPELFIYTSTKDDRVHPGHARKMTAKMQEQGHNVLYYENIEGGHAARANLKQLANLRAMEYNFLKKTIFN